MYVTIPEVCDYVKKVMGKVSSLLTGNGICNLLCEWYRESNLKCTIGATHANKWKHLWDEGNTTANITSDKNNKIVDTDNDQSEVETYQNHTYVEISAFVLENVQYLSSTNE